MNDEKNLGEGEEEFDEENIVVLSDEEGNDVEYEFLDCIEYQGGEFVVLLPLEGDDSVVIMEVDSSQADADTDTLVTVEDGEVLDAIYQQFKERNADMYDFED